jgi:hypothetical protein
LRQWVEDRRRLGIVVSRLTPRAGAEVMAVPLDHPALSPGWWGVERDHASIWCWTDGNALLSLSANAPVVFEGEIADPLDYPLGPEICPIVVDRRGLAQTC